MRVAFLTLHSYLVGWYATWPTPRHDSRLINNPTEIWHQLLFNVFMSSSSYHVDTHEHKVWETAMANARGDEKRGAQCARRGWNCWQGRVTRLSVVALCSSPCERCIWDRRMPSSTNSKLMKSQFWPSKRDYVFPILSSSLHQCTWQSSA